MDKFKLPLALSLVGIVLIIGGIFASGINERPKNYPKESIVDSQKMISVDISGAVNNPGVYKLSEGARAEEAIASAGGFAETANQEYISKYLNMAQKLSDGSKVYVPMEGESAVAGQAGAVAGTSTQAQVNINTGSQSELEALPGIGPVTATKIISNRPYQEISDLINKKVVSNSIFEKIKEIVILY